MASSKRNRTPNNASRQQSPLGSFLRSPIQSSVALFDRYFLHQSPLFYRLAMLVLLLVGFGLISVQSSSNVVEIKSGGNPFGGFGQQLLYALVGLGFLVFFSTRSIDWLESVSKLALYAAGTVQLLVKVPGVGVSVGGNTNWIRIFGLTVQPSEFLKLGLVLYLSHILAKHKDELWDFQTGPKQVMMFGFGSAALVYLTSFDMGTAIIFVVIVLGMSYLAGMPAVHFNKFLILTAIGGMIGIASSGSRRDRILALFMPGSATSDGLDWQSRHGIWALANGGLFGVGPGNSTLNWGWIPEVENDFIFANIAEEWGMLGALVVIIAFFLLGKWIRNIAQNSNDSFGSLVAIGVMLWVLMQALINISVVLNILPVLGVPLPLISKGGSSIVAVLMALGVVLAVERVQAPARSGVRAK